MTKTFAREPNALNLRKIALGFCCLALFSLNVTASTELNLWFEAPASDWEKEGLPIGNGAMGAVITGGISEDVVQFNEKTLWEGGPGSKQGYDFGIPENSNTYQARLASIQSELQKKRKLTPKYVAESLGRSIKGYGNYQSFGNLVLSFPNTPGASKYRRELDLATAMAKVSYSSGGINYTRRYFASYPHGIIGVHLTANKKASLNLSIALNPSPGRSAHRVVAHDSIIVSGAQEENGLHYEAQLSVKIQGGTLTKDNERLKIENADEVLLLLVGGTDYAQSYPHYRGELPHKRLSHTIEKAKKETATQLIQAHKNDYQALFSRVILNLGGQLPNKPINQLLNEYKGKGSSQDLALEALYFQYGRYLLIASSRPGSLPANLQGVWNNSNRPPWNADYHVNINLQMNYWPADVTNLSETNEPLFNFIDSLMEPGAIAAKKMLNAQGWTLFLNTNIYGFTGVIKWPTAFWQPEAGAWLAQHYYEHYLFTQDNDFLRTRAYPAIKGATEFWLDALTLDSQDNLLVVNPSYSPEHGDFTIGSAMSQQIVYDLLRNAQEAATILKDKAFAIRVSNAIQQLDTGTRIGSWGQLQEWKDDLDDPGSKHRHISHLFALHPGRQISPISSPELAEAARKTLASRGDAGTGWSKAWKINLWARLFDGDHAHKLLAEQLQHSTLPNMWDTHPPFQIDGNFGATAGVAEMLLQSHNNEIHLLPALPSGWKSGSVTGLKARGNVELDITWKNNTFSTAKLKTDEGGELHVRINSNTRKLRVTGAEGKIVPTTRKDMQISFQAKKGGYYQISSN